MAIKHRSVISLVVFVVLAGLVLFGRWYSLRRGAPGLAPTVFTVNVTSGADRGAGSLREALFTADAAPGPARVVIQTSRIAPESALPPLVNPRGVEVVGAPGVTVEIDAHALSANNPVFDIDAEHAAITGLVIDHCAGIAVLVRAARFRMTSATIRSCDVGVEIAGNASEIALERNVFDADRIGIRFSGPSRDTVVVKNEFTADRDAGLWLVASQADSGTDSISVHDNTFSNDGSGAVLGNVSTLLEHNEFSSIRDAAIHVIGAQAVVRNNHITSGVATGIVAENARSAVIEGNELDHLQGYGILLRNSSDTVVRGNRITSCGYGMAFVLGDVHRPNTAVDNTMIDLKYNGIDVIGESPILRHNQVSQARAFPLHVADFSAPNGDTVHAQPLLDKNSFQEASATQGPVKR